MLDAEIIRKISSVPGEVSFYYQNLVSGETAEYASMRPLIAASVIKIPVLIEAFRQFENGMLNPDDVVCTREADKVPSCGALTYLHTGISVTWRDVATLMIILSDNTATNMLIDKLGIANVNDTLARLGCTVTHLGRKMFDAEGEKRGIRNFISAREIGVLLAQMDQGKLLSAAASAQMLGILKNQRLNGKVPFYLHAHGIVVAHKTGEDDRITHDVGIVYAQEPFVVCFAANDVDVPAFERVMQDVSRILSGV